MENFSLPLRSKVVLKTHGQKSRFGKGKLEIWETLKV